jgi:hypothetical protein
MTGKRAERRLWDGGQCVVPLPYQQAMPLNEAQKTLQVRLVMPQLQYHTRLLTETTPPTSPQLEKGQKENE